MAFLGRFGDRFDHGAAAVLVPPEVDSDATQLLRRLLGQSLRTITGHENRILGVEPPNVVVATERSPSGQPVPIAEVEAALERLTLSGSVTIQPEDVGYRSAFVGAVLLTLPGATASGSPPVIHFEVSNGSQQDHSVTFEGDLSRSRQGELRGEQRDLRRVLFGLSPAASCALCGDTYSVRFLIAAHIKPRSVCTAEERRDLSHIGMPACVFGCDALFETGFIAVDADGTIIGASNVEPDTPIGNRMSRLIGRRTPAFTEGARPYFEWHRRNKFRR